eukprot:CAMPEP_0172533590 /NCGR_PEP_ID=MMETSP1067-20121228/6238_1 /TAXON_ID=265564 ORGANISM="Thalassiosira punctigera, Strain Tpunct2005C2" /NCGR_SAMPLE_ID=MMETSP1067 /ASSEMBLY_ACC=CAM_ASM_000444 /LENGTH=78 /DNA_ID=CAMNT_0013318243 /DNA_START=393 /DNA_END=629 /DNA_ORIENTATION=-
MVSDEAHARRDRGALIRRGILIRRSIGRDGGLVAFVVGRNAIAAVSATAVLNSVKEGPLHRVLHNINLSRETGHGVAL